MEPKKFVSGPAFLSPIMEQHNDVVSELNRVPRKVSGSNGISVMRVGRSVSIASTIRETHFRFGVVIKSFNRGGNLTNTTVQLCAWADGEWHRTNEFVEIETQFLSGYFFSGMGVRLLQLPENKLYQIMSEGVPFARFTITDDLIEDESVTGYPTDYLNGVDDSAPRGVNDTEIFGNWGGTKIEETDEDDPDGVDVGTDDEPRYVIPKILGCFWNDGLLRWEAVVEKCP